MVANHFFGHPMQPLRGEHRELLPYVERRSDVGDAVGEIPLAALQEQVDELHAYLAQKLLSRACVEGAVIYPLLASTLGTLDATSMMNRDHIQLRRFTDDLATVRGQLTGARLHTADAKPLRRILYSLSALLQLHLEQEEVCLGLLDARLKPEPVETVCKALKSATRDASDRA